MKQIFTLLLIIWTTFFAFGQDDNSSLSIALNQDNGFGFAPAVYGTFGLDAAVDLTYYGIFWTNHAYSNNGIDNWLETGIGVSFLAAEEQLFINPSLGFTHGSLLSGTGTGNVAEGIVPNVLALFANDKLETEFYFGYYKSLRKGGASSDFILYWLYPGWIVNERLSLGAHYEQFYLTRDDTGASQSFYQWLGAYAKFTTKATYSFRFSMGRNLNDNGLYARDFYKLSVLIPLP